VLDAALNKRRDLVEAGLDVNEHCVSLVAAVCRRRARRGVGDVLGHDGTRMVATVYRHAVTPTVTAPVAPMEAMFGQRR